MEEDQVRPWLCALCGCHGSVVQLAPHTERRCRNGHRWADGKLPHACHYIPLSVRLDEATAGLQRALSALQQAETMIKDCSSMLEPAQRSKLSVHYELHQIEQAKAAIGNSIELAGGRVGD